MAKVQFQVNGLDSNTESIFNEDVTFDGNVDVNSISIAGTGIILGDSGWVAVTSLSNSFTAPTTVAYRKLNNVVYMRGNLFDGTANTGAFTLPSGYRPSVTVVVPVQKYGTPNLDYVTIGTDGVVTPNSTAAWLSSVVFPVG